MKKHGVKKTKEKTINIAALGLGVRQATLKDLPSILRLKGRLRGLSLKWGEKELCSQLQSFPKGQLVVLCSETSEVVGSLGSSIIKRDRYSLFSNWADLTCDGTIENHDPQEGKTLLRTHLVVDPAYEAQGVRDLLIHAELDLAHHLKLEQIRAGVRFRNYGAFRHKMPGEYLRDAMRNNHLDTWIHKMVVHGFQPLAVVTNYYEKDFCSEGYAVVWQKELKRRGSVESAFARASNGAAQSLRACA